MGIILAYYVDIGSLEKSDVLPLGVKLKLRHWPSTAYSFIYRLTNRKPVFPHLQNKLLIGQSGQILASDWLKLAINSNEVQKYA